MIVEENKLEFKSVEKLKALKESIETATGESYNDLTGAVKKAINFIEVCKNTTRLILPSGTKIEHITFYLEGLLGLQINDTTVKTIKGIDVTSLQDTRYLLSNNKQLETIYEPLDFSNKTAYNLQNAFDNLPSLVTIFFVPETIQASFKIHYSPLLSNESKQSIFDGLAIVTTAQTVTFHEDVKLLQSQVDSANAKGWTVAGGKVVSEEEYYG